MSGILHIVHTDETADHLAGTGLDGEVLVWREIFSVGPLAAKIAAASFWEICTLPAVF